MATPDHKAKNKAKMFKNKVDALARSNFRKAQTKLTQTDAAVARGKGQTSVTQEREYRANLEKRS